MSIYFYIPDIADILGYTNILAYFSFKVTFSQSGYNKVEGRAASCQNAAKLRSEYPL